MRLTAIGALLGAVGAALLLFEGIRATSMNTVLGSTAQTVMWAGFGVMALGGLLLIASTWAAAPPKPSTED